MIGNWMLNLKIIIRNFRERVSFLACGSKYNTFIRSGLYVVDFWKLLDIFVYEVQIIPWCVWKSKKLIFQNFIHLLGFVEQKPQFSPGFPYSA